MLLRRTYKVRRRHAPCLPFCFVAPRIQSRSRRFAASGKMNRNGSSSLGLSLRVKPNERGWGPMSEHVNLSYRLLRYQLFTQFPILISSILLNSLVLFVTSIKFLEIACAAINKSIGPIIFP